MLANFLIFVREIMKKGIFEDISKVLWCSSIDVLDKLKENQKYWETTTGLNKKQASICWVNCTFEIWYFMILSLESSSWLNNWNNISLKIEYEKKKLGNVLKKVFSSDLILEDFPDCYSEKKKNLILFCRITNIFWIWKVSNGRSSHFFKASLFNL